MPPPLFCYNKRRKTKEGLRRTSFLRYSNETYAAQKASDPNAQLRALVVAMMRYGDATSAFCGK